jgi:Magnesium chelatase, subunit ChlI
MGMARLGQRLTPILLAKLVAEAIETTRIHRVAGLSGDRTALVTTRPCRAPHHPISDLGLIGGDQVPIPGEVSLAHYGVRCLDERPEFRRHVLGGLRQPLETDITAIQFPVHTRCRRLSHIGRAREARSGEFESSPLSSRRGASTPGTSISQRSRGHPHSEGARRIFHSPSTGELERG